MAASRAGFAEKRAGKPPLPEGRSGYLPSAPHVPFAVLPLRVLQISLSGLFHSSGLLTVDPVDCLFPSYRGLAVQLVWLYRACANVQQFRVSGLRFTPLASVILSCMPLVGMVLNALIIQELYRASKNPEEWMLQSPSLAVRLYLTAATALTLSLLFPFGVEHYLVAFFLIGSLITAASILWLISVLQISRMQRELASRQEDKLP